MEKNHRALDTGGGRDVKIGRDLGLGRFQAQPKWEIPAKTTFHIGVAMRKVLSVFSIGM